MTEPTRAELEAQLATMQRQLEDLQRQLATQPGGPGGQAQGGGIAAGQQGVAAATIQGPVATGDHARQIQTLTYIEQQVNQVLSDPTRADPASLRLAYLARLYKQVGTLELLGVDPKAATDEAATRLRLDAVYTALLTQSLEPPTAVIEKDPAIVALSVKEEIVIGEDLAIEVISLTEEIQDASVFMQRAGRVGRVRHPSALEELNRHPHLVLLGDPGGGKSTFVNFVALCLAGELLQQAIAQPLPANLALLQSPLLADDGSDQPDPQPWDHGRLLPVRIILRDFAASGLPPASQPATAAHLWTFIDRQLQSAGLADYTDLLRKELLATGGLVLFDGLDEVPEAGQRRVQIRQAVEDFAATFRRCRLLVTSRTYAYQHQAWRLDGFAVSLLAPLSDGQIRRFVERWYAHSAEQRRMDSQDAQGRAALLQHAIFASDRLRALAGRPLLLTLIASLHAWRGGKLPDRREELYADAVDLLLDRWESQRIVRTTAGAVEHIQPSLAEFLKVERLQVQQALNRLAFQVHAMQPALVGVADIDERDLVGALLEISRNASANPLLLLDYLSQRAGLLVPHGVGVFSFPHRTFQEYLAAWHLTDDGYPDKLADLARRDPDRWREVALLAGAKAARGTPFAIWSLVDALSYREPDDPAYNAEDSWGSLLAAQALVETVSLSALSPRHQRKVVQVRRCLLHLMRQSNLPALERARAGRLLAHLGDPRPEALTVEQMRFCPVPAGPFEMGEGDEQHTNPHLQNEYWMAQYPVTNAQFQHFVAAGGYARGDYWPEAIQESYWNNGMFKGMWDTEPRNQPYAFDEPFNLPNHPVVGVSWYEALAFTRWLTDHLHIAGLLPATWRIVLPSEAEWEKAARGGARIPEQAQGFALPFPQAATWTLQPNPIPVRPYPWEQAEADPDRANYAATNLSTTSAVGCFLHGASPYGVEEMVGNVWEWTRSIDKEYPFDPSDGRENLDAGDEVWRIVRGGSWYNAADAVGCGYRYWYLPYDRGDYLGFRVVASPSTSGL